MNSRTFSQNPRTRGKSTTTDLSNFTDAFGGPEPGFPDKLIMFITFTLSLNREGRSCTTDDSTTSFLHLSLSSTALWDLANSWPVHSMIFSSYLFFCLPYLVPPFTVPCKMSLARPGERETCPYCCSLRLFTMVRRSSCGPIACWILALTSSLVTWSL